MNETAIVLHVGTETLRGMLDPSLLRGLGADWSRRHAALPVRLDGAPALLYTGPSCLAALQEAQFASGESLRPVAVPSGELERIAALAFDGPPSPAASGGASAPCVPPPRVSAPLGAEDLGAEADAPVPRALNAILADAIRRGASDVHLEPAGDGSLRVRLRIDGLLRPHPAPMPPDAADALVSRVKVMARMDIAERRLPQDGMAQVALDGRLVDIRVSTVPVADGERVVMRLLDRDNAWAPLEALGMDEAVRVPYLMLVARPHGLVVVSGPTGSGKTTTLYSTLATLDAARRNILTVEDPVEYRLPDIGQIQVKPKIGLTFAAGLRHILRQDPDVILVGETRDAETAEIAVRAALTGHLVFTTLHTNDAPSAVARLVDMGVERYLLASCLRGVLAQRLVRRLCPVCARPASRGELLAAHPGADARALLDALPSGATPREPVGCDDCLEGRRGRLALFEFMGADDAVAAAIRDGGLDAASLRAVARARGAFHALAEDAAAKVSVGAIDIAEAVAALGS